MVFLLENLSGWVSILIKYFCTCFGREDSSCFSLWWPPAARSQIYLLRWGHLDSADMLVCVMCHFSSCSCSLWIKIQLLAISDKNLPFSVQKDKISPKQHVITQLRSALFQNGRMSLLIPQIQCPQGHVSQILFYQTYMIMFVYFSTANKKLSEQMLTLYNFLLWPLCSIQNVHLQGLNTHDQDFQTSGGSPGVECHSCLKLNGKHKAEGHGGEESRRGMEPQPGMSAAWWPSRLCNSWTGKGVCHRLSSQYIRKLEAGRTQLHSTKLIPPPSVNLPKHHMVLGRPWSARVGGSCPGAAMCLPSPRSLGVLFVILYQLPEYKVAEGKAQQESIAISRLSDFRD